MKRLLRKAFSAAIFVSFLLFIASILMWVHSYHASDGLTQTHLVDSQDPPFRRVISLGAWHGGLEIGIGHMSTPLFDLLASGPAFAPYPPAHMVWSHLGFRHRRISYRNMLEMWFLEIPFWLIALIFATPPSIWLVKAVRRKHISPASAPSVVKT